ncbi:MAG TPA: T9SS type A sorting domain-containing protein [Chitinophagales bacterium]|nr:T9SS type A sorting domain-containing protein [Chitinophagales bacterium]
MKLRNLLFAVALLMTCISPVWADTEPDNDLAAGADAMTVGDPATGTINMSGDLIDFYAFTTSDDGTISLDLTSDVTYLTIRLYDADGVTVLQTASNYSNVSLSRTGLAAGNYYAAVVAYAGYSGTYDITATVTAAPYMNDTESNNTYLLATDLTENGSTEGHIGYRYNGGTYDTDDWYKVVTTNDGAITATFANTFGAYNTIYIYDNDGTTVLGSSSNYGSSSITIPGKAAGTYYIRLYYYSTSHFNGYTLSNTVTPTAYDNDAEPNDLFSEATVTIPENDSVSGHIGHRYNGGTYDTDDWYLLELTQDGQINLNLNYGFGQYHGIYLYDSDGTTVLANNFNYNAATVTRNNLSAGTYYAKVDNYSSSYHSGYILEFEAIPAAYANDTEPNDVYTQANTDIPEGGTVYGHIGFYENGGTYDTDDWFTFTTTQDGIVSLTLNADPGQYHGIYIYDNNGTTLLSNDFNYTSVTTTVNNLAAGDYYAKVDNYSASYHSSYALSLSVTPPAYANDPEPNGSLAEAVPMLTNSTVEGHIGYRNNGTIYDQNDYYVFTLSEPGDVTLSINKLPGQYNTLYLLNSVGATLESQSNYGAFSITENDLPAGVYYARLHYYSTSHFGGYALTNSYCPDVITIEATGETTFCDGESVVLSTPDHHLSYLWNDGSVTETNTVVISGDNFLTIDNGGGCVRVSNIITTESTPLPVAIIETDGPAEFCDGGDVTLSVPALADTYLWSNGATTPTITVNETGDYSVILTKNGCTAISDPIHITVNALPVASVSADGMLTFCDGESVTLTANEAAAYLWSNGETTASILVTGSGDYSVEITDDNGCMDMSEVTTVTVNANPIAAINADGPTTFCSGESVTLTASGGDTYLWNNGETTSSILVTTSGLYSATVYTAAGCSDITSTIEVVVEACGSVTIVAEGPTEFCDGNTVTLTSSEITGNVWNTGETTQSIVVDASGDYYCTNGANTSNTITVTVFANPIATITPDGATAFCAGGSVMLNASAAESYLWNTGATTASILADASGDYSVTVTDINGCFATSMVTTVIEYTEPVATISAGGPTTFCEGGNVELTASEAESYLWNTGATTESLTASSTGAYFVTITDINGCTATSGTITVTVNPNPTPVISADGPVLICGTDVTLSADAVYDTYLWSNGETTPEITTGTSGVYSLTVTSGGCSGVSNTIEVVADVAPTVTIESESTLICFEASTMLTATTDGANIQWQRNGVDIPGATDAVYYASENGKYRAVVTTGACESTSSEIKLKYAERLTISPAGVTDLCGGPVTMNIPAMPGLTYQWYRNNTLIAGATGNAYTTTIPGKFYCLANADGCTRASKLLVVNDDCRNGNIVALEMSLWPNPASDYFTVSLQGMSAGDAMLRVSDIAGQVIFTESVYINQIDQTFTIPSTDLPSGMYCVTFQDAPGNLTTQRVIIQR